MPGEVVDIERVFLTTGFLSLSLRDPFKRRRGFGLTSQNPPSSPLKR